MTLNFIKALSMQDDTRVRLLAAAKRQFADKGFYGVSIAQVASELGLTKQALLYHFKRKEDLYAEVMQGISDTLLTSVRRASERAEGPQQHLEEIILGLFHAAQTNPEDTRLLVRELLDNRARAETARDWYLKPFLAELMGVLKRVPAFEEIDDATAFCSIYQLLGGVEYFTISTATLTRMYGPQAYARYQDAYADTLRHQLQRLILCGPNPDIPDPRDGSGQSSR